MTRDNNNNNNNNTDIAELLITNKVDIKLLLIIVTNFMNAMINPVF